MKESGKIIQFQSPIGQVSFRVVGVMAIHYIVNLIVIIQFKQIWLILFDL